MKRIDIKQLQNQSIDILLIPYLGGVAGALAGGRWRAQRQRGTVGDIRLGVDKAEKIEGYCSLQEKSQFSIVDHINGNGYCISYSII